jgi:hypothetical protein
VAHCDLKRQPLVVRHEEKGWLVFRVSLFVEKVDARHILGVHVYHEELFDIKEVTIWFCNWSWVSAALRTVSIEWHW